MSSRPFQPGVNAGPNTACGGKDRKRSSDNRGTRQPHVHPADATTTAISSSVRP
ncbi:MAG: hypothetical protein KKE86_13535 [Planctomycetes bacterium]|nr:hypothetical protein [Planctomycetota bacterium]